MSEVVVDQSILQFIEQAIGTIGQYLGDRMEYRTPAYHIKAYRTGRVIRIDLKPIGRAG